MHLSPRVVFNIEDTIPLDPEITHWQGTTEGSSRQIRVGYDEEAEREAIGLWITSNHIVVCLSCTETSNDSNELHYEKA